MQPRMAICKSGALMTALFLVACAEGQRQNVFLDPDASATTPPSPSSSGGAHPAPGAPSAGAPYPSPLTTQSGQRPVVILGESGSTSVTAPSGDPIQIGANGSVSMRFERIEAADFARTVLGETLGLSYQISPDVGGVLSLQIARPVPKSTVLPIARRSLAAIGVAIRRDGDVYFVEPDPSGGGASSGGVALVRHLNYADRAQLETALQAFLIPEVSISPGPGPDMLIVSGDPSAVRDMNDLISALDVDPLAGRSFALLPLSQAPAREVRAELSQILGESAAVIDIERSNAVLIVAEGPEAINKARFWVNTLDRGNETETQFFVYRVQNRRAVELAEMLQQGMTLDGDVSVASDADSVAPGLERIDISSEAGGSGSTSARLSQAAASDGTSIFADEGANSIVVVTTPQRYRVIENALRRMDVEPAQVLIEATIIEVGLQDELSYGVRWFFESGNTTFRFSDLPLGLVAPTFPGFNFVLDNGSGISAVVSALDEVTDVEVVASPSLMVLDNQTARLQIGDQVPVATTSAVGVSTADAPIVNTIEQRDTGVILEITPRVNASGVVLLDILQEISNVVETTTSGIDSPTIQQRSFKSSVLLHDRETLALGGLIRTRVVGQRTGIPLLSDVPLLGEAFKSTGKEAQREELLVALRPIVIRNNSEARAAYQELRSKLQGLKKLEGYLPAN